mmetsp:Transcript_18856/g.29485  ORF Transcript_18856/g.29485 Transcript_18856/m.29485 type:complete len:92 (-) Transcript_18856:81-356(-)
MSEKAGVSTHVTEILQHKDFQVILSSIMGVKEARGTVLPETRQLGSRVESTPMQVWNSTGVTVTETRITVETRIKVEGPPQTLDNPRSPKP